MEQSTFLCACGCGQFVGINRGTVELAAPRRRLNRFIVYHHLGPQSHLPAAERFWSYVDKTDACWRWTGALTSDGYGSFSVDGRTELAHRFAWVLTFGPIPPGMQANHDCPDGDDPRCVNPAHLWLGTQDENNADAVQKGRRPRGEAHRSAKLLPDQVREIRRLHAALGLSYRALGRAYRVNPGTVWYIVNGLNWRHLE